MTFVKRLSSRVFLAASTAAIGVSQALAQANSGGGALNPPCIPGLPCNDVSSSANVKAVILRIIAFVLDFLAIIAVLFIIIAGIRLIVSQGEEEQKEKAKKTILYVIVGLIVIIFARIIVGFVTGAVPGFLGAS